jgi:hypothetical protein
MPRAAVIPSRLRRERRPFPAVALLGVLMLLTAPLRVIVGGCDLCPPDCPMHAAHRGAEAPRHGAPRMHCHNAPASADADPATARISRPPCGTHAAITGLDLAPMLPAQALTWAVAPRIARAPADGGRAANRAADPPDTPPPDARA